MLSHLSIKPLASAKASTDVARLLDIGRPGGDGGDGGESVGRNLAGWRPVSGYRIGTHLRFGDNNNGGMVRTPWDEVRWTWLTFAALVPVGVMMLWL